MFLKTPEEKLVYINAEKLKTVLNFELIYCWPFSPFWRGCLKGQPNLYSTWVINISVIWCSNTYPTKSKQVLASDYALERYSPGNSEKLISSVILSAIQSWKIEQQIIITQTYGISWYLTTISDLAPLGLDRYSIMKTKTVS